ncbi:primary-amine oxidase [Dermatobacter hominis]|uniref:primary-amine oxidase n=1 Tax=Dermatobacter hominis TaxID=2884263 RepID=UPI001D12404A|nr:primary-amine oxidase [Dermatobacter hominis]UDY35029.1 primary-amine oxidase [Dermatobacter hominis]
MTGAHPLSLLSPDEVTAAKEVLREAGELPEGAAVAHVVLDEPHKDDVAAWRPGVPVDRRVRVLVVPGPELTMVELVVSVTARSILRREVIEGMRPALLMGESLMCILACKAHPDYVAALARRGIVDLEHVQIDPWPAGAFGYEAERGRRIARCISFVRTDADDNGYARPVEGVVVHVDLGRGEVIEVIDHAERDGVEPVPVATSGARYGRDDVGPLRSDLRPISITQPEGPSFTVEDGLLRWQRWSLRLGWDPYEGLVLHQVTYDDPSGGDVRTRSVLHRASISEMVVPYGDPGEGQGWKNAFDAGEWGLGRMTQPLTLGCDCLGEIRYVDVTMADERCDPWIVPNAICLHEEDVGIGWKHVDLLTGRHEVRRSRRMVISHIATVGNYEYGFFWYLYLDGGIQLEVKLTGIMSTQGVPVGTTNPFATTVAPGVAAPVHQHLFCARLDLDVDGTANRVEEVEAEVLPAGRDNPWANAFRARATVLERECEAQREVSPSTSRSWRVTNVGVRNGLDQPVGYKLVPTMSTPTLLARPESSVARRAGFARHNLWVTPYHPDERRAAGDFPNQHEGGDGLPLWSDADRDLVDTDVVLWYSFGLTHFPRPEDWPVMPVECTGFLLSPCGFFDRNPALDVPPPDHGLPPGEHCSHHGT